MSSQDKASKTEKATPKKVRDARLEGQVAKSIEVSAWSTTLAMTLLVPWTFGRAKDHMLELFAAMPDQMATPDPAAALALWGNGLRGGLVVVAPMALALLVLGVVANVAQVGLVLSPKALKPKLSRLNPLPGFKRLLGTKSLWAACKEFLKLVLLGAVAYHVLSGFLPTLIDSGRLSLTSVASGVGGTALSFLRTAAMLGMALAAADYAMMKHQFARDQRMSKHDIKDEGKKAEGDPMLKGERRQRQLEMSRNRMMADVASADVVMVNPTHVAVALRYDPAAGAPRVVAKGQGLIATKIRERAEEHRVPMVRDIPLARALHAACDVGDDIPADLYTAVARVLAFLFSLKSRGVSAGTHSVPQPAGAR